MEFVASRAKNVNYMIRCIWITCQAHQVMQEFVQGRLHPNAAIATVFIHFLVKTTAGSLAAGGGGQLKTLTDMVEKLQLQTAVAMVLTTSKDVAKNAKEAITCASMANTNADAEKNTVNAFYSKNPSLKR